MSRRGSLLLLLVSLALAVAFPFAMRRGTDRFVRALPGSAVHRAREALSLGDVDGACRDARRAVAFAAARDGGRGDVGTLVEAHIELARDLLARGRRGEGRLVAWSAIRLEHESERAIEDLEPWLLLGESYAATGDVARFSQVLAIAAEHADRPRERLLRLAPAVTPEEPPGSEALGDLPAGFDLRSVRPVPREGGASPLHRREGDTVSLLESGAFRMEVDVAKEARGMTLVAASTAALGISPIVAVTIDGGEPWPIVVRKGPMRAYRFPGVLAPGRHVVVFEYLNDVAVPSRGEDRNVRLLKVFPSPA